MKIGLAGNHKVFLNANALTNSYLKSAKVINPAPLIKTPSTTTTKKAHLSKAIYHDKAMWLYLWTDDSGKNTSLNREYDFENITAAKEIKFYLRNSGLENITFEGINLSGEISEVLLLGVNNGDIFKPNEYRIITIRAEQLGDLLIDGAINLNFSNKQVISIYLNGERAVVFSYLPNYEYTESKELKTDIFTSQNGKEFRRAKRSVALRIISFNVITKEIDNGVEGLISFGMHKFIMLPLWFSCAKVLNKSGELTDKIKADTLINKEFKSEGSALIYNNFKDYEVAKISGIYKNEITLSKKVSAKKFILPLIKTTPKESVRYNFFDAKTLKFELEFKEML
ncbi:MAG: hypothetical protein MR902_07535 [Campylobacter sp.]|nr:hypothetical protein [Campylobacter sp.]